MTFIVAPRRALGTRVNLERYIAPPERFDSRRAAFPGIGTGTVRNATNLATLQSAVNAANGNDRIQCDPAGNYDGTLQLRAGKTSTVEITLNMTAAAFNALCPEGTQMTPARAASIGLPKIRTTQAGGGNIGAITSDYAASNYRFVGIEVSVAPSCTGSTGLIRFGDISMTDWASQASWNLILDRCYVHGSLTTSVSRGVQLCGPYQAVVDTYLEDFYGFGQDSQAVWCVGSRGPYQITRSHLDGFSETFMSGGGNSAISPFDMNGEPSDLEFTYNYLTRKAAFYGAFPGGGTNFGTGGASQKNGFELKTMRRALIAYNRIDNTWADGQSGFGVLIKSTHNRLDAFGARSDTGYLDGTCDIEFAWNLVSAVGAGMNFAGNPDGYANIMRLQRVSVHDNLVVDINQTWPGDAKCLQVLGTVDSLWYDHNTNLKLTSSAAGIAVDPENTTTGAGKGTNINITNSILQRGTYGLKATGTSEGNAAAAAAWASYSFQRNAISGLTDATNYPFGTLTAADDTALGLANLAGGDYRVLTGALQRAGTDNLDIGVTDVTRFLAQLAGVA